MAVTRRHWRPCICLFACLALIGPGCAVKPGDDLVKMFGKYCEEAGFERDSSEYYRCIRRVAAKK